MHGRSGIVGDGKAVALAAKLKRGARPGPREGWHHATLHSRQADRRRLNVGTRLIVDRTGIHATLDGDDAALVDIGGGRRVEHRHHPVKARCANGPARHAAGGLSQRDGRTARDACVKRCGDGAARPSEDAAAIAEERLGVEVDSARISAAK